MPEQSESAQRKTAAKSSASLIKARDEAGADRVNAIVDAQLAEQAQHDAKVALQNAKFAELGEQMDVTKRLGELNVTVKGNQGRPESK